MRCESPQLTSVILLYLFLCGPLPSTFIVTWPWKTFANLIRNEQKILFSLRTNLYILLSVPIRASIYAEAMAVNGDLVRNLECVL